MTQSRGFVLNASGDTFLRMAVKLARSLRTHCPDVEIDLFTDAATDDAAFTRVHVDPGFAGQGKIPAMRASRFDRSIYMDVDMMAVADLRDVFDVLDAFDIALTHDQYRNSAHATRIWRHAPPPAFPQFNGGLIAWRRNPATLAFLEAWEEAVADHGQRTDQPALRELLWADRDLRHAVLPEEYNLWDINRIDSMSFRHAAPRVIHNKLFKRPRVLASEGDEVAMVLGARRTARMQALLDLDLALAPPEAPRRPEVPLPRSRRMAIEAQGLRDIRRKLGGLLRRPYP